MQYRITSYLRYAHYVEYTATLTYFSVETQDESESLRQIQGRVRSHNDKYVYAKQLTCYQVYFWTQEKSKFGSPLKKIYVIYIISISATG